ncbi:MAG TPA: F0F1 ATP synthase subunit B [Candidatus Binataceae bacterium]|nr:F0F1 ATP synthase subunit B [Candidatus Binataceae bacterium]
MSFSWTTFALQAVNFLVLVWLLKRFLFKPVAAIIAQRKDEISRALADAESLRQRAEQARKDFESRQAEIEAGRQEIIDRARAQIGDERARMIEDARADIEKLKAAARTRVDEERETAAREVFARSIQIAVRLAQRLLEQFSAPRLEELFLDRVLDHLDHLSAAERTALLGEFGRDGARLLVTTAHPLSSDAESKWRATLGERLGARAQIAFATDKELIAGAELGFPHAILRFSWRDTLADAQRDLNHNEHPG